MNKKIKIIIALVLLSATLAVLGFILFYTKSDTISINSEEVGSIKVVTRKDTYVVTESDECEKIINCFNGVKITEKSRYQMLANYFSACQGYLGGTSGKQFTCTFYSDKDCKNEIYKIKYGYTTLGKSIGVNGTEYTLKNKIDVDGIIKMN